MDRWRRWPALQAALRSSEEGRERKSVKFTPEEDAALRLGVDNHGVPSNVGTAARTQAHRPRSERSLTAVWGRARHRRRQVD